MTYSLPFFVGVLGSLVLLVGAAYPPEPKIKKPIQSKKNRLFGIGGLIMLVYAIMGYVSGGSIFFVFLEVLIAISSILMMVNTNDRFDAVVLGISGLGLIVRSFYLFEGYATVIFVLGLAGLGLGYAFKMGSFRRDLALTIGSLLVAFFSYLEANRIFFFLNIFFAIFSLYYTIKRMFPKKTKKINESKKTIKKGESAKKKK